MYAKLTLSAAFVALAFSHNALAADHNLSADILVVGAGSAGLTAAVQAAEKRQESYPFGEKSRSRRQLAVC
jgi:ribulose 1,5-bisphosphate synthetase/thiazole synthase